MLQLNTKFELGRIVATPSIVELFSQAEIEGAITRHSQGDWGDLSTNDVRENELALVAGNRLLSAYRHDHGTMWVITEGDGSTTTLLLPDEY
ncbi:hypothetical protein RFF05_13955 [Bengtsoniella intestinalis]|uniref:type I restriction endonuclease subunit M n=1 Tax=Bengtsoniella intestinalis TaxID=3073143 RepID=UPI00391F203F